MGERGKEEKERKMEGMMGMKKRARGGGRKKTEQKKVTDGEEQYIGFLPSRLKVRAGMTQCLPKEFYTSRPRRNSASTLFCYDSQSKLLNRKRGRHLDTKRFCPVTIKDTLNFHPMNYLYTLQ